MRAATLIVYLALAAILAVAALAAGGGETPPTSLSTAGEGFAHVNSRDGAAIFSAADVAPGDLVDGNLQIGNSAAEDLELTLSQSDVTDVPGAGSPAAPASAGCGGRASPPAGSG